MKALKALGIVLVAYVGLVVAFESLVVFMGKRQAERGVQPGESWLVITTTDADGSHDTVVAGVEIDGQLYVAANHWPRGWFNRAVDNPEVEITCAGSRSAYRAVPVAASERARVMAQYEVSWLIRFLTGFPPRAFLHLVPR